MQLHEEAKINDQVGAIASAIEGEKTTASVAVDNAEVISKSLPVASGINAVFENMDIQLGHLDFQVKQVEKYLKEFPVDEFFKVSENTKAKQEVRKALQTLKASISLVNKNKNQNRQARLRISQDSAETYFKKLYNEKALTALKQQLDAQFGEVSAKTEAGTHYNSWKQQDEPEIGRAHV